MNRPLQIPSFFLVCYFTQANCNVSLCKSLKHPVLMLHNQFRLLLDLNLSFNTAPAEQRKIPSSEISLPRLFHHHQTSILDQKSVFLLSMKMPNWIFPLCDPKRQNYIFTNCSDKSHDSYNHRAHFFTIETNRGRKGSVLE